MGICYPTNFESAMKRKSEIGERGGRGMKQLVKVLKRERERERETQQMRE